MKKRLVVMVIILAIFCGAALNIKVNSIKLMQESCIYRGETYQLVSPYCITGEAIGYVDLISRGYEIEGDEDHNYLFVLGDLYKRKGYTPNCEKVTGIFIGKKGKTYCDEPDILQIMESFDEYMTAAYLYDDVEMIPAQAYESNYCLISLCYDEICASDELYGFLFHIDGKIYFALPQDWWGLDKGVPFNLKLLDSKTYPIFEPYFSE